MASIFTWASDTPRVSSPWLHNLSDSDGSSPAPNEFFGDEPNKTRAVKITRLQAEPQEGPIEYKLHLLLRPRRKFKLLSTGTVVAGSQRSNAVVENTDITTNATVSPAHPASTQQTRQHRLQQLTTQLLWRLQQSSPHHTSSATNFILPSLPEALPELRAPQQPGKLLHGLEESQGALYEIGVSDDGTLVGLAEDELQESLNNLRAMAACLGCTVEVLRKQAVGHCEWIDDVKKNKKGPAVRRSPLFVAEALIKPHLQGREAPTDVATDTLAKKTANLAFGAADQLRLTLTGPTMSGKSTLLGTLTTSTLDTGRGKSRLSLFKHRHEITSGITSSVTQELFGYQDLPDGSVEVVNYATENVASWIDIHAASADSRLVFVSDSAGHPRYRRTTVRSLVGWAPHWTLFCIPANESDDSTAVLPEMDLAGSQLDLCLRLRLPLVVVITKLDLASRTSLKNSLTKVLDALKAAGRKASIFPNANDDFVGIVGSSLMDRACDVVVPLLNDPVQTVPIVLTSAVQGTGISNLHALLHELPIPAAPSPPQTTIYHVEDVYNKPAEVSGIIVSGHLRSGEIAVGDEMVLGPFSTQDSMDDSDSEEMSGRRPSTQLTTSRSFPGALHSRRVVPVTTHYSLPGQEWKRFTVTSIRNLRLPSHALLAGQVGTIAIVPCDSTTDAASLARIRKGMVLTHVPPATTRIFAAEFDRQDLEAMAVGNHVVVYIASIRASAKVVSARAPDSPMEDHPTHEAPFEFEDDQKSQATVAGAITAQHLLVTFSFDSGREYLVLEDKVLVMPGGGPGLSSKNERGRRGIAGLDGFVGRIVELLG